MTEQTAKALFKRTSSLTDQRHFQRPAERVRAASVLSM
jgi:hypothetical protein